MKLVKKEGGGGRGEKGEMKKEGLEGEVRSERDDVRERQKEKDTHTHTEGEKENGPLILLSSSVIGTPCMIVLKNPVIPIASEHSAAWRTINPAVLSCPQGLVGTCLARL